MAGDSHSLSLLERIPNFSATSNNDTMAMALVMHAHTNTSLALGNQRDPIFILGHISRSAPRAFGSRSFCPCLTCGA